MFVQKKGKKERHMKCQKVFIVRREKEGKEDDEGEHRVIDIKNMRT